MTNNQHQFQHTLSERRASVIVGSVGRGGFLDSTDFNRNTSAIDDLTEEEDNDIEDYTGTTDLDAVLPNSRSSSMASESHTPLLTGHENTYAALRKNVSNKESFHELVNEEARLLASNHIQVKNPNGDQNSYHSITPYGSDGNNRSRLGSFSGDREIDTEIMESFDDAVQKGLIKTTYSFELKRLTYSAIPLIITFLLQNSLSVASIFSVGHIGSVQLAAVTLGSMTANITGFSLVQGLATALDTFLPQAYGAKKYKLVGLIFQRCTALILVIMIFVCSIWWLFAENLLISILPDPESAQLAAKYLKVVSFGVPGYILFETGKRFLQAQGIFHASTYVLFICAPLNAFMNYFFVWSETFGIGYLGAPLSVAINYWLMALGLLFFTVTTKSEVNPLKCWDGLSLSKAFQNWGGLFALALPSVIMIEAEFLAFEVLTLGSSYLGTKALASQSVITTLFSLVYQLPFGVSIAASTRVANYLGAGLPDSAKISARTIFVLSLAVSVIDFSFLMIGRYSIPNLFTNDDQVKEILSGILPLIAVIQSFDALNATTGGCLRGMALQKIAGYVNLLCYYLIGLPLSFILAFKTSMKLFGLWVGSGIALLFIGAIQTYVIFNANWRKLSDEAISRSNSD
ncbi:unnamed protein product [[Candida] boidinii]|uniref:Unnamed protein product n=1 Tax=Candida boidinii TaxID=5477 RepID=A0A9W6WH17_CANBO|nr:hypothetical protein B5S30_g1807 [[Candida] boidinii]GME72193.1 unnamed protein product [[Candida] boidinii]GMF99072.1 unnamed protein product [[Candida] boidinii]